jgi:nanoRNase/pAp phosphatase (c-di-AMP/oligoRNAs hydrolase)
MASRKSPKATPKKASAAKKAAAAKKFRLVTRSDFDGLVCAVLLREKGLIDEIVFVHPKDMQDGKIPISASDITTNLPYVPGAHLVFDHHRSESIRNTEFPSNYILDPEAPSAARVVYNHYGGAEAFPTISLEMLAAVDKADAARYSMKDILNPQGWELLSFIMDARTGLGRFRDFTVSNYQLMMELIDACQKLTIDQILELGNVKERVELYHAHDNDHKLQIKRCSKVYDNCVVLDLRDEPVIYAGNRFTLYAAFLQCNVSIQVIWGRERQNTVFALGKSILNKLGSAARLNIGEICLKYGGGGHGNAGTCQVENERASEVLDDLIGDLTGKKPSRV